MISIMKWWLVMITVFSVIFVSWTVPVLAEAFDKQLHQECIDGYIQFTYIDLQSGTLSEIEKIGFANFWFEKCMNLKWDLTTDEFMNHVNDYLAQHGENK